MEFAGRLVKNRVASLQLEKLGPCIVPTRAICNLSRSWCDCCARTFRIECRKSATSRFWTIVRWECAGDFVGPNLHACMMVKSAKSIWRR